MIMALVNKENIIETYKREIIQLIKDILFPLTCVCVYCLVKAITNDEYILANYICRKKV